MPIGSREAFTGYLSALTAKQVEDYKVKRRATVAPATVNRELALLKHMCTKAVEWGYLKANPLKSVKFLKEPPGRLRYLTQREMDALVEACHPSQTNRRDGIAYGDAEIGDSGAEMAGYRFRDEDDHRAADEE